MKYSTHRPHSALCILHCALSISLLFLSACSSARHTAKSDTPAAASATTGTTSANAATTVERLVKGQSTATFLTASVKVGINAMGKDLNVNGRLQMKRNDVVRLSLRFLGMEVGVMEFTPTDVLVVDRVNKQYVRAAYTDISFLRTAGLDFHSLEALFWNQIFVPGETNTARAASRFHLSTTDGATLLSLTDAPSLNYHFRLNAAGSAIERLEVSSKNTTDAARFLWTYSGTQTFGTSTFPQKMTMNLSGTGKDATLSLDLSSLKTDSNWNTRTTVSAKYTRRTPNQVLRGLGL